MIFWHCFVYIDEEAKINTREMRCLRGLGLDVLTRRTTYRTKVGGTREISLRKEKGIEVKQENESTLERKRGLEKVGRSAILYTICLGQM